MTWTLDGLSRSEKNCQRYLLEGAAVSLSGSYSQLARSICLAFLRVILALRTYLGVFPCNGGLQAPFITPLHISSALA
jgi:hypothetical protein